LANTLHERNLLNEENRVVRLNAKPSSFVPPPLL
jgi:hypothetical protein